MRGSRAGADAYLADPTAPGGLRRHRGALLRLSRAERALKELLEREQQARREAEAANRLKDDFLATLSHELRTPLNAIVGWTTLMRTIEMDDDARRHAIEIIERNAKAQAALIEDLLDVSRITQGQLQLDLAAVARRRAIVAAAIDTIRPSADAKGSRSRPRSRLDPRAIVRGDPARLQQVFWNLLSNAVKFTPAADAIDGPRSRDEPHVEVEGQRHRPRHRPEFLAERSSTASASADAGTTRAEGGLGLGLSIARQLVEMHGGTLTASSGARTGATFHVRLPRQRASRPRATQLERRGAAATKENAIVTTG